MNETAGGGPSRLPLLYDPSTKKRTFVTGGKAGDSKGPPRGGNSLLVKKKDHSPVFRWDSHSPRTISAMAPTEKRVTGSRRMRAEATRVITGIR